MHDRYPLFPAIYSVTVNHKSQSPAITVPTDCHHHHHHHAQPSLSSSPTSHHSPMKTLLLSHSILIVGGVTTDGLLLWVMDMGLFLTLNVAGSWTRKLTRYSWMMMMMRIDDAMRYDTVRY